MQVAVVYQSKSDHERVVLEFEHEYARQSGHHLQMHDTNTRNGAAMASLYGIVAYPAVLALGDDGQLMQQWQGTLPLFNDLRYYTNT